jgi:hypothetical protein
MSFKLFKFPQDFCHDLNTYHKEGQAAEATFPGFHAETFSAIISSAASQMTDNSESILRLYQ